MARTLAFGPRLDAVANPSDDERLLRCNRGHLDWFDEDECAIGLRDGSPVCRRETETRHEAAWRCAKCDQLVARPSGRAELLDAVCWPTDA